MEFVGWELNAWHHIALRTVLILVIIYFVTPYVLSQKRVLAFPTAYAQEGSIDLRTAVKGGYVKVRR
jgi:hypothetical protein